MQAQSVLDVILGEAKGGDFNDMLAVASAIVNRANALGVTPEQVVGVSNEFNAYGKPLPAGVGNYRNEAQRALAQALENPSHNGMFYATPAAQGNLPSGLKQVASTAGHNYFMDPLNRSIKTTEGYKTPFNSVLRDGAGSPSTNFLLERLANGHGPSHITGMDTNFRENLANLIQSAPPEIQGGLGIGSGTRTVDRQAELYRNAVNKYGSEKAARAWVAPPGRSNHNPQDGFGGRAADLYYNGSRLDRAPKNVVDWVHQNAGAHNLKFPLGNEPWHAELMNTRGGSLQTPQNGPIPTPRPSDVPVDPIMGPVGQPDLTTQAGQPMPMRPVAAQNLSPAQRVSAVGQYRGTPQAAPPVYSMPMAPQQPQNAGPGRSMTAGGVPVNGPQPQGAPPLATAPRGRNPMGQAIQQAGANLGEMPAVLRQGPDPSAMSNPAAIDYLTRRDGWNTGGNFNQNFNRFKTDLNASMPKMANGGGLFSGLFGRLFG